MATFKSSRQFSGPGFQFASLFFFFFLQRHGSQHCAIITSLHYFLLFILLWSHKSKENESRPGAWHVSPSREKEKCVLMIIHFHTVVLGDKIVVEST